MIDQDRLDAEFALLKRVAGFVAPPVHRLFHVMGRLGGPGGAILEIGVFGGQSLLSLACAWRGRDIVGVDPFFDDFHNAAAMSGEDDIMQTLVKGADGARRMRAIEALVQRLREAGHLEPTVKVNLEPCTQEAYFERPLERPFGVIHIDGEHSYPAVRTAMDRFPQWLVPGAWVVFDDFPHGWYPGIVEAVYTHPEFRVGLQPVAVAFGKGVFAWRTDPAEIERRRQGMAQAFQHPAWAVNRLHDGAWSIQARPVKADGGGLRARLGHLLGRLGARLQA